jgi:hypothetical protein
MLKKTLPLLCVAACLLAAWFWGSGGAHGDGAVPPSPTPAVSDAAETPSPTAAASTPIETPDTPPPSDPVSDTSDPSASAPRPAETPDMSPATPSGPNAARDPSFPDAAPADIPPSAKPQEADGHTYTCTLSVRCDTLLDNLASLDPEKHELVPADGVIFPETAVTFSEGENAFTLLKRELQSAQIHLEFVHTPLYNSAYIEGIHNLFEFDAGELSGWMYKVNGWFPNYGCARYLLRDGDTVEFVYTCDLGRDVGGNNIAQY